MSLKVELETWAAALKAYDAEEFAKAIDLFNEIADNSKILTSIGLIYATLGEHEAAVQQFVAATELDQYLAVAYFQCGVSNFLLQRYDLALQDFEGALLQLRGNEDINYEQLGLKFKLYAAEVFFNKGLSMIYMGNVDEGLAVMMEAQVHKVTEEHNVIDDAIAERGDGYTVFSIPIGVLYRPSETKLKNTKTKDYMGKAKLVATSDASEAYTTFTGVTRLKQGISPSNTVLDDAPAVAASLTRAVTVAVTDRPAKPDLDRQQSSLQRAKTTINVPADARERIRALGGGGPTSPSRGPGDGPGLGRSATTSSPTRGLSVRRPGGPAPPALGAAGMAGMAAGAAMGPGFTRSSPTSRKGERLTEFYDSYLDSYGAEDVPPVPGQGSPGRVANWARSNANAGVQRSRSMAPSSYAPSSVGGPLRRKTTRRTRAPSRGTYYEEEEEGYASGDYDDGPLELIKIRVKIHYKDEVRGMAIDPSMSFDDFVDRITIKFNKSLKSLDMKFKDEDGGKVSLRDESDYEMAIETVREHSKDKSEGKLEIWCSDV